MPHHLYTPPHPFNHILPNLIIGVEQGSVVEISWQNTYTGGEILDKFSPNESDSVLICQVIQQLDEYFLQGRQAFDFPLKFIIGTEFQKQVWTQLAKIPYGQTISYKELAGRLGKPTAYRAVANANGKNPLSLVIPCHRVIASSGELGGYTGGVVIKETLLGIEQCKNFKKI